MWSKLKFYGAWILAGLLSALGALFYAKGRKDGQQAAKLDVWNNQEKRVEKGREAVRNRDELDPDERLRENDGKW